ncbi:MAG: magnesium/cobalt transporter CorA, partial [Halobacteria archaeon]|nr:magnesium/cobalt transporter CorA [Halobacteria archaeon]
MRFYAATYVDGEVTEHDSVGDALRDKDGEGETWIHLYATEDEYDSPDLNRIMEEMGIHSLEIEDILEGESRPKTEEFETHTFVLLKTAKLSSDDVAFDKEVRTTPVGFFIGESWLVTISASENDLNEIERSWEKVSSGDDKTVDRGADFVAYRIMDSIVDSYFNLLDEVETDIEAIEERILTDPSNETLEEINDVRRDMLAFRKIAWPSREAISYLSRGNVAEIREENQKYFRNIHDHLIQVVDLTETYRELTMGSRDMYMSTVSQSTNEVMKTLTVVATIFIPLTFVVGVYGMNFTGAPYNMPELEWRFGYPAVM